MSSIHTLDDATADLDATARLSADPDTHGAWHEKTVVVVAFGCLALVGLAVLVIAVVTVSNDSTRPDAGRHPLVTSASPTPPPAAPVPPSPLPTAAAPLPTAAQPPPTEASPAPATATQPPAATPSPVSTESGWPRWRHWLWAHQHPAVR